MCVKCPRVTRVTEDELRGLLRRHASSEEVPGAALGVLRDGAVTTAFAGVESATTDEPVTSETRFAVGSLTKSMVATVIARLAEADRLALDDPAAAHVPELQGIDWAEQATLRDLLANRSRLPLRGDWEFVGVEGEETTCFRASRRRSPPESRPANSGRTRCCGDTRA